MPTNSAAHRLLPHLRRVALARDTETGDGLLLGTFVASHDETAFATLVRRHGPMVLGVCRRVIGDPHLAEDAFQATFLVLARRAAVVRPRHLVGHWLYGVAYRTALKARGSALRRKAREKQVDAMPQPPVSPDEAWTDLQAVLDAELARLPDKYRIPVVLCDLGGRPQREVARELRLPPATLANRLAAARRLLAKRLTTRGVVLSGGAVAAAMSWHAATCAVPPALAICTVKAACAAAAGTAISLPAPVVQLSEGVMRMFVLNKLKAVATGIVTCMVVLTGLGLTAGPSLWAAPEPKPASPPVTKNDSPTVDPHRPLPDDLVYFRQTSLDLRGVLPTNLEVHYFMADTDQRKRDKVLQWMLPGHGQQKVSASCQTCHGDPVKIPMLGDIKYFDELFTLFGRRPIADAAEKGGDDKTDSASKYKPTLQKFLKTGKPAPTIEQLRDDVEKAKADVEKAEKELKLAEKKATHEAGGKDASVEGVRERLLVARHMAALAAKRQQDAAELKAKDQTAKSDADRIARDLDRLIGERLNESPLQPTDGEFLRRVLLDVRGTPPTTIEVRYFEADKDPKKREKLLKVLVGSDKPKTASEKLVEDLLSDPAVQRRWAELSYERAFRAQTEVAAQLRSNTPHDRLDRLLDDMIARKKSDEQMLNALCLATLARYPTETEQTVILDGLKGQPDRRAAWQVVLKALAATSEAKAYAAELSKRGK